MYEMEARQYDPAIARWVVIDPVVHHSMSPYNAFDNNPVFWADPSGANAIISNTGVTFTGSDAVGFYNALLGVLNNGEGQFEFTGDVVDDPYNNRPVENASQEGPGDGQSTYIPPPKELPGFPGATRLGHQNGKRPAWRLPDGSLAEWDSQHGELEVYDKTGKKHKGAYDPETGEKKPNSEVPGRKSTRSKYIETLPTMTVESTRVYRYQREPGYPFNNATFNPPSAVQTVTWGGILLFAAIVILSPVGM